jgi:hypothetical protein
VIVRPNATIAGSTAAVRNPETSVFSSSQLLNHEQSSMFTDSDT